MPQQRTNIISISGVEKISISGVDREDFYFWDGEDFYSSKMCHT